MTYMEVQEKLIEAKESRFSAKEELEFYFDGIVNNALVEKLQRSEYQWGYWDGIAVAMRVLKVEEICI